MSTNKVNIADVGNFFCLTFPKTVFICCIKYLSLFYFMQVQNQQQEGNRLHQIVTDTVSDLYDGIDSIIEAAKSYVQSENVQDADKLVDYIDSYVKYMHKLIDTVVESYTSLFKNEEFDETESNSDEISNYKTPSQEEIENFQEVFENCLQFASNATAKVQKKLSSILENE